MKRLRAKSHNEARPHAVEALNDATLTGQSRC